MTRVLAKLVVVVVVFRDEGRLRSCPLTWRSKHRVALVKVQF